MGYVVTSYICTHISCSTYGTAGWGGVEEMRGEEEEEYT